MRNRRFKTKEVKITKKITMFTPLPYADSQVRNYDFCWSDFEEKAPFRFHPICTIIKKEMYKRGMTYVDLAKSIIKTVEEEQKGGKKNNGIDIDKIGEENLRNVIHKNNVDSKYVFYMLKALDLEKGGILLSDYFAQHLFEKEIKKIGLIDKNNLSNEERKLYVSLHDSIINNKDALNHFMRESGYYFNLECDEENEEIMRLPKCYEQEIIEIFINDRDYFDEMINGYRERKIALQD